MKWGAPAGVAGVVSPFAAARSCAASCSLAAASACDSSTSCCMARWVAASALSLPAFALASLCWLVSRLTRRIETCWARPSITRVSWWTVVRIAFVRSRAAEIFCFALATSAATCLSWAAIAFR